MDRPVISEDIVELSASMENLAVQSKETAEFSNTENDKFKKYCLYLVQYFWALVLCYYHGASVTIIIIIIIMTIYIAS